MAESGSRTQILVACISLVGVIGTALIANWRTIFPNAPTDSPKTAQTVTQPPPQVVPHPVAPKDVAPKEVVQKEAPKDVAPYPMQGVEPAPAASQDEIDILGASPPSGSHLKQGELTNFRVTFHYRLTSLQSATLSAEVVQFDNSTSCSGTGHIPAAQQVPMYQGGHTVSVEIPYTVGVSKTTVAKGSIGFSASIWSDIANRKLFKTFQLPGHCYAFD